MIWEKELTRNKINYSALVGAFDFLPDGVIAGIELELAKSGSSSADTIQVVSPVFF